MSRPGAVRVLGGALRGRNLPVPGARVRPTEGKVREALAAIWQQRLPGSRMLDLFAGSGAVGVEAASRGAARVTFVERAPKALAALRRLRRLVPSSTVIAARLPEALRRPPETPYDLIFADPPYRFERYGELVRHATAWLAPGGELAVEHPARIALPDAVPGFVRHDLRRYGEIALSFYRHAADEDANEDADEAGDEAAARG